MKKLLTFYLLLNSLTLAAAEKSDSCLKSPAFAKSFCKRMHQIWTEGNNDLYLSGYAWHNRHTYSKRKLRTYNEKAWGGGFGKGFYDEKGNWHALAAIAFLDSHKNVEPAAGYVFQKVAHLTSNLNIGAGYAILASFGELFAWIVGWDLLLEYAISVPAVAVGWSGYFNDFLLTLKIHMPNHLLYGPEGGGLFNLSAFSVIVLLSLLLICGVKSSSRVNNLMVLVKLLVIFLFIAIAVTEVKPQNWSPFMPYGWQGVAKGASMIFFAYIGFDAVSTAAEEAKNPQRDLPIGIIGSLMICTILYIVVAGLLTGIASYSTLNVSSPISHVLLILGYKFAAAMVGVGAVAGLTTVMLVLFFGLSRIFLAMARDGLLPEYFAVVHGNTKSPVRIIIVCGLLMALLSAFVPMHDLAELVNIGTLFAFIMVCLGVIILRYRQPKLHRPFKTPLMPFVPALGIISCLYLIVHLPGVTMFRFGMWMFFGLIIYVFYSRFNSKLN